MVANNEEHHSSVSEHELADASEGVRIGGNPLDLRALSRPGVLRAVLAILLGLTVLVWPDRTDQVLVRLVGVGLIVVGAMTLFGIVRLGNVRDRAGSRSIPLTIAFAIVQIVLGLILSLDAAGEPSFSRLGSVIGFAVLAYGLKYLVSARLERRNLVSALIPGLAFFAIGALFLRTPEAAVSALTTTAALAWVLWSGLVLVSALNSDENTSATYRGSALTVQQWLLDRPKAADDRTQLYDKILFDGPDLGRRVVRFFSLMAFASVIASTGVIADSTAVVIGAMLIAPLMTPLMGMAISLVMGWPNRLLMSAAVAAGGILLAISIGFILGLVAPAVIDTSVNAQILARATPTPLDLITAIAAGAAGAYGLSRPDVSDSLPGVAIAISLVPPLTVVGIAWSQGDFVRGNGSLLLFATNMLAILIVGGLTFVMTGVTPLARVAEGQARVGTALTAVAAASAVVLGGLLLNGTEIATNVFESSAVADTVEDWIDDSETHSVVSSRIDGSNVEVVVAGPSTGLPSADGLADALSDELGRGVVVDLQLLVQERFIAVSD